MEGLPEISDLVARSNQVYEDVLKTAVCQFVVDFRAATDRATQQGKFACSLAMSNDTSATEYIMSQLSNKGFTVEYDAVRNILTIRWSRT